MFSHSFRRRSSRIDLAVARASLGSEFSFWALLWSISYCVPVKGKDFI
jgi:hypothetical protein